MKALLRYVAPSVVMMVFLSIYGVVDGFFVSYFVSPAALAAVNGSSGMATNVAMSLVSIVYNIRLLQMIGEDGVAAYDVIMYVAFVFEIGSVMLLPLMLGLDGIWLSVPVAEGSACDFDEFARVGIAG